MITLTRSQWLTLITSPVKAAPRKSPMPIDQCIQLHAFDGLLSARAGERRISVRTHRPVDADAKFDAVVDAHDLLERVKAMPDGNVSLSVDGPALVIKGASRRFALPRTPGEDMPTVKVTNGKAQRVDGADLAVVIRRTQHAVSTDETRQHVSSLRLVVGDGFVHAVSTDGHRLAVAYVGDVDQKAIKRHVLVPRPAVGMLLGLAESLGELEVIVDEKAHSMLAFGPVGDVAHEVTFALADAAFPPWEQVIPKESSKLATISSGALSDAVRAVAVAASDRAGGVNLQWVDGGVTVTAESPDRGDASDHVECIGKPEATEPIGLNSTYIVDALGACMGDVQVQASDTLDPVVIRASGTVQVLMPMRV